MQKKVDKILYDRKVNAEKIAQENLEKALQSEDFKENYKKYRTVLTQTAKNLAFGLETNTKEVETLKNICENDLQKIGLSLENLQPQYTCKFCCDTGIVLGETCACAKQLLSQLQTQNQYSRQFHTFSESKPEIFENKNIVGFYQKMQQWANAEDKKKHSIIIRGGTGVGKTFLLECLVSELINQKKWVLFTSAYQFNADCLASHLEDLAKKQKILNAFFNADVLVIDDLGSEPFYKNVTKEYLFLIVDKRMQENKSTLISTNLTLEELRDRYGDRIFSRLINKDKNIVFEFVEKDLRLKK